MPTELILLAAAGIIYATARLVRSQARDAARLRALAATAPGAPPPPWPLLPDDRRLSLAVMAATWGHPVMLESRQLIRLEGDGIEFLANPIPNLARLLKEEYDYGPYFDTRLDGRRMGTLTREWSVQHKCLVTRLRIAPAISRRIARPLRTMGFVSSSDQETGDTRLATWDLVTAAPKLASAPQATNRKRTRLSKSFSFDTNVYIDAAQNPDGPIGAAFNAALHPHRLCVSKHTLEELANGSDRFTNAAVLIAEQHEVLPCFPVGSIADLLGNIEGPAGTFTAMHQNESIRTRLADIATKGTSLRDRGALVDALAADIDYFVTNDAGISGRGPRSRIADAFSLAVINAAEFAELIRDAS